MAPPARSVINMADLKAWTLEAHSEGVEACGIVCGDTAFRLANEAKEAQGDFLVSGPALQAFFYENPDLLEGWNGVWHSHPSSATVPSAQDVEWHPMGKSLLITTDAGLYGYIIKDGSGTIDDETGTRRPFGFSEMWHDGWLENGR